MGDPSTFTINALTGPAAKLELKGRCLPYQGLRFEGIMRAEITRYPGNPVASVQMLGPEEKATAIKGMWKDRFIASGDGSARTYAPDGIALFNGARLDDAFSITQVCTQMRLAGQLVEVTWDSKVRRGIISRFSENWIRREDVEWEMEFEWISRGEEPAPVFLPLQASLPSFSTKIRALVDKLISYTPPPTFQPIPEFLVTIETYASEIDDAAVEIQNAVSNVAGQLLEPAAAAERVLAAAESLKQAGGAIIDACESFPPAFIINRSDNAKPDELSLGEILDASDYQFLLSRTSRDIQATVAQGSREIAAESRTEELLAAYVAREKSDLRDVSTLYYGTPDEWRTLLQFNSLSTSELKPGQVVLVPKINQAEAA